MAAVWECISRLDISYMSLVHWVECHLEGTEERGKLC